MGVLQNQIPPLLKGLSISASGIADPKLIRDRLFLNQIGSGVLGLGDLMEFAENMSPLGNASAEDCADYVLTLFSDLTRKVTMQNLYHDGGFSSMGMSRRAMKTYEKGMRFEDVHENQYPFGK